MYPAGIFQAIESTFSRCQAEAAEAGDDETLAEPDSSDEEERSGARSRAAGIHGQEFTGIMNQWKTYTWIYLDQFLI